MINRLLYSLFFIALILPAIAQKNPVELGEINWIRDLDEAIIASKKHDKSILVLFQEVPGCSTCRNYGKDVLSHPLIVEAIETLFIPLCIHNNKKGKDAQVLKMFNEPSWNNPVVRILDSNKKDIIQRVNGRYTALALVQAMNEALQIDGSEIPNYLQLLESSLKAESQGLEKIYLSMYCFWSGELTFGELDGVYQTKAGFMDGKEVVELRYLASEIDLKHLFELAKKAKCADGLYCDNSRINEKAAKYFDSKEINKAKKFELDKTPKYYLSQTAYKYIPMTAFQACRANSLIGQKKDCQHLFSPRQLSMYRRALTQIGQGFSNQVERYY